MRLSLKATQVAGVTALVALVMVGVNLVYLVRIARISLEESQSRGELLARTVYQAVAEGAAGAASLEALGEAAGLRVLVEAGMAYSPNVTYVALTDPAGRAIVHSSPVLAGEVIPPAEELASVIAGGPLAYARAIYSDRTFEVRERLLADGPDGATREVGAIRVGLSMLLVRENLRAAMRPTLVTLVGALAATLVVATLFAQWLLRPIHVVSSGLSRLGRGEFDVRLDLPGGEEFDELGRSFNALSAELSAARTSLADHPARLESVVDRLENAVAIVGPGGELMFANRAMRELLGPGVAIGTALGGDHPLGPLVERAVTSRETVGPVTLALPVRDAGQATFVASVEAIADRRGRYVGALLSARNLAYLSRVRSTLRYSQKLAALGRLLAGVAHEVKNPLNAMTIHLELLRQKLGAGPDDDARGARAAGRRDPAGALRHVEVIADEIRRLDTAVQGFLKFSRPEELALAPVAIPSICDEVARVVEPQARAQGVTVEQAWPASLPPVYGDSAMLRQAVMNLALNAIQAMPDGGTLRLSGRPGPGRTVELVVEDTGVGIAPEHLPRIFDLYFTTREGGTGLGLSMVYRTVHLHDGSIEVESTPGHGTVFRVRLPQA